MIQTVGIASSSSPISYLIDSNICIYVINVRPRAVLARFMAHEIDGLGISAITASLTSHW